jgi:uncharacterized FlgJ-related protein
MSEQTEFLNKGLAHAQLAHHPFPEYATCEAALESGWGKSRLAREANNLFGEHQHTVPVYETYTLHPNDTVDPRSDWVKFPSWKESFESQLATIKRLSTDPRYPHYATALQATSGEVYVREVSIHWAQDTMRADKVLTIHRAHFKPTGEIY